MAKAKAASKPAAAPKNPDPKPTSDVMATTPAKCGRPSRKDKENVPSSPIVNPGDVPATPNGDQCDIEEENKLLREKLTILEAKINAEPVVEKPKDSEEYSIQALQRPKGEAGDCKKGFILIDAMRLNKNEEKRRLYNSILNYIRCCVTRAELNLDATYRQQELEKLGQVFHLRKVNRKRKASGAGGEEDDEDEDVEENPGNEDGSSDLLDVDGMTVDGAEE